MNNSTNHTELRKLAEAATQGLWKADENPTCPAQSDTCIVREIDDAMADQWIAVAWSGHDEDELGENIGIPQAEANARFIAASNPQAIIALLDERDKQRDIAEFEHRRANTVIAERDSLSSQVEALRKALSSLVLENTGLTISGDAEVTLTVSGEAYDFAFASITSPQAKGSE